MRIRTLLVIIGTIVILPGLIAAGLAIEQVRQQERAASLRVLTETVRATALLVDGEVQRSVGALEALGNSEHLQSGNLHAFYEQAKAINQPSDVWTLLLDESGRQVLNTALPFGTPAPPPRAAARVRQVLATGLLLASDVIRGPATGKLLTTLYLPAKAAGADHRYVVAQAFSVDHWKRTALRPQGRGDWVVAVIDRQGNFISRSHRADDLVGQPARPELVTAAGASFDGLIRHQTIEGIESYDAFTHSRWTGWTIAVAAPVSAIETPATQSIAWLVGGLLIAMGAGAAAATFVGRKFIQSIEAVSLAAQALACGKVPVFQRGFLRELNRLGDELTEAGQVLRHEKASRQMAEAQREQLLSSERAAREAAESMNASKDSFLALLGHELRNPLAAISGATAVLRMKGCQPDRFDHFLSIIDRQNRHLAYIVNDLLDVSRMLSGKLELKRQQLDLAQVVHGCLNALETTEQAQGYELVVRAETAWVEGDLVRLEQVVNNLVGNALKHSPAGTRVNVTVSTRADHAVLEVTDVGTGMGAQLLPTIFDPFVQGPPLAGRMAAGLGIGLSLVRQLVTLHGGQIVATSRGEGCGSEFVVTLPLFKTTNTLGGGY